jgi:hypothetical protein
MEEEAAVTEGASDHVKPSELLDDHYF